MWRYPITYLMLQICELVYSFKIVPFFYVIDWVSQKQISLHFILVFDVVSGSTVVQLNEYSYSWCTAGFPRCYVTMYHFHFSNNFSVVPPAGRGIRGGQIQIIQYSTKMVTFKAFLCILKNQYWFIAFQELEQHFSSLLSFS